MFIGNLMEMMNYFITKVFIYLKLIVLFNFSKYFRSSELALIDI